MLFDQPPYRAPVPQAAPAAHGLVADGYLQTACVTADNGLGDVACAQPLPQQLAPYRYRQRTAAARPPREISACPR